MKIWVNDLNYVLIKKKSQHLVHRITFLFNVHTLIFFHTLLSYKCAKTAFQNLEILKIKFDININFVNIKQKLCYCWNQLKRHKNILQSIFRNIIR